jgi:hypothetical protein
MNAASSLRVVRIVHAALVIGLIWVGVTFVLLLRVFGFDLGFDAALARVFAGVGVGILTIALLFLRGRTPARRMEQAPEDYWASSEVLAGAIPFWAAIEGAGLVGWIGYLLTGEMLPAAVAMVAIVLLLVFRPSRTEGQGSGS